MAFPGEPGATLVMEFASLVCVLDSQLMISNTVWFVNQPVPVMNYMKNMLPHTFKKANRYQESILFFSFGCSLILFCFFVKNEIKTLELRLVSGIFSY